MLRGKRHQRGAAAVELGLLMLPLVAIGFGASEFGRAMFEFDTLAKNARNGARYLVQFAPGNGTAQTAARCMVVYGNTGCTGTTLVPGLTTGMVLVKDAVSNASHKFQPITVAGTTTGVTNLVTVTISGFGFQSMISGLVPDMTFSDISVTLLQAP